MTDWTKERLMYPAIGLIAAAVTNGVLALLTLLSFVMRFESGQIIASSGSGARRAGYYFGNAAILLIALASIIAAPLIFRGALEMMRGTNYTMARMASILAIIPATSFCCVIGVPLGIWAFVTLKKPEVKAIFGQPHPNEAKSPE